MERDLYEVLGVAPNASVADIKRAYRRLARDHHPDTNPDDPEAETRFKEVSTAYAILSDPEKRRRYDTFGLEAFAGAGAGAGRGPAGFGLADLFEAFFGGSPFGGGAQAGPARALDVEARLDLTLEEVITGATRTVPLRTAVACERCHGSGCQAGTHPRTCPQCNGSGEARQVRRSVLGQLVTVTGCPRCSGEGTEIPSPCPECGGDGRRVADVDVEVEVPAGIADGQRLRLAGRGPAAPRGGRPGDLYVEVHVADHPRFERHGDDLVTVLRVPMTAAALGGHHEFDAPDGVVEVDLAPGTDSGGFLRFRGRGVPSLTSRRRGDLVVRIDVETPSDLSADEEELLRRLAALRGENVVPPEPGFLSRIKSSFR